MGNPLKAAVDHARGQSGASLDSQASLADDTHLIRPTRTLSRISTSDNIVYKVYKRRFFGLAQLVLLNIVASWGWISFAPISDTASQYFNTSESNINWISTAYLFAFVPASAVSSYTLHRYGCKASIMVAAGLLLVGSWIKYGATRANSFPGVMVGQLLLGFAQPFVLASPTSYSNIWFSPQGRTTATAVASLANPFGAALGQLISPFWADKPSDVPNMVLYVSIISSIACVPAFFIPSRPPSPPSAGSLPNENVHGLNTMRKELKILLRSPEFFIIFLAYSIYVGLFNAFSSLINQLLEPYGFSEDNAGIAGAVLIVVGLVFAAISSPIIDKYKFYLAYIKSAVPVIAISYLIFIWAPATRSLAYVFVVCALLGAASFGLVPVVLEFLVEIHYPLGPELASTLCWCGGQLLGGIFIVIMDALKDGDAADPPQNMHRALIFQAVFALIAVPGVLALGLFGRHANVRRRRWEADQISDGGVSQIVESVEEREQDVPVGGEPSRRS
ncbi:uncharacterized protein A1O9_05157 [Exophiala aquamarina CBS 119918]|uniref:Major facilitator superfamily (MFS) profile domain-containing protein n=1 Tax=Exophiala aquamarina CBS 119918 TaxID=1182545 RepID=A0A072PP15_9EURO|nr:uncharacterized protein A1O9_05157 [Exophiala aquamarina CBS 119918]KEF57240.1 hypothetical protein A1O9_05157 [Exophiala aquamarina CBS 119918]